MNSAIESLNALFTAIFNCTYGVVRFFGEVGGLTLISIVFGIIFLIIFSNVSNQPAIRRTKEKIHGAILEAILFRSDIWLSLKAQGKMLLLALQYLGRTLPPLLIIIPLCIPVLAQLNRLYGVAPLDVKSPTIVEVVLKEGAPKKELELVTDPTVKVDGPVRDVKKRSYFYRLTPTTPGSFETKIATGQEPIGSFLLTVGTLGKQAGISSSFSDNWVQTLLYPSDRTIVVDSKAVKEIRVDYPEADMKVFGYSTSWIIIFFVVSLVAGLVASKMLKIEV